MATRALDLSKKTHYRRFAGRPKPDPARVQAILKLLDEHYPNATCALRYETPFQLLIATILSAQTTDEVVNKVTPQLFARYPDAEHLARARQEDVEKIIRSTGFYRNKAKNIIAAAKMIHEEFGDELPRDIDTFVKIPGAARKTANVVLGTAFGIASGVVVDTHVARVTRRWHFHDLKDPVKIEKVLMVLLPRDRWISFSHQVIWHGRRLCMAKKPKCDVCPFLPHCPEGQKNVP
ncbi:MAG: endonuclease III [Deltaproteobacteria bacterium]|nr:MAG: endonuclease III [Deltaproteobacteria bacterium]